MKNQSSVEKITKSTHMMDMMDMLQESKESYRKAGGVMMVKTRATRSSVSGIMADETMEGAKSKS